MLQQFFIDPHNASDVQLQQFFFNQEAAWDWFEDAYFHYRAGLFDEDAFAPTRSSIVRQLSLSPFRAHWIMTRSGRTKPFADFVDDIMRTVPVAQKFDVRPLWNMALEEAEAAAVPRPDPAA
jgi:hypothetical protein